MARPGFSASRREKAIISPRNILKFTQWGIPSAVTFCRAFWHVPLAIGLILEWTYNAAQRESGRKHNKPCWLKGRPTLYFCKLSGRRRRIKTRGLGEIHLRSAWSPCPACAALRPTRGRITSMVKALKALTDVGGFREGHRGLYTLSSVRREGGEERKASERKHLLQSLWIIDSVRAPYNALYFVKVFWPLYLEN